MKFFIFIILLVFPIFFSFSTSSLSKTPTLCELSSLHKPKVKGIFNLGPDLVIQMYDSYEGVAQNYTFWRVYGTDKRPAPGSYGDINDEGTIDQRIRDRIYKMTKFNQQIDEFASNATLNPNKLIIRSDLRISTTRIRKQILDNIRTKCEDTTHEDLEQICKEYSSMQSFNNLFCLYGENYAQGIPVVYHIPPRTTEAEREPEGEHMKHAPLMLLDVNSCKESDDLISLVIFSNPTQNDTIFTLRVNNEELSTLTVSDFGQQYYYYQDAVNVSQIYHLFKFNDYYRVMSCPKHCTFDTPLFMLVYVKEPKEGEKKLTIVPTDLTLNRMLGCQQKSAPFDPHYFCYPGRVFTSVISYGGEIYYQNIGRFWRYNSKGFTQNKNNFGPKLSSIRLDSYMTAFLEKEGIDTSYKVMSFGFKRVKTLNYHYVCVFGITNEPKKLEDLETLIGVGVKHTLYGLHPIENADEKYSVKGCKNYPAMVDLFVRNHIRIVLNPPKMPKLKMSSIAYNDYIDPNHLKSLPTIWSLYNYNEDLIIVIFFVHKDIPNIKNVQNYNFVDIGIENANLVLAHGASSSMFVYKQKNYFYIGTNIYQVEAEFLINALMLPKFTNVSHNTSIYGGINCPFKTSTSLVTIKRELICSHSETTLNQSVIDIGLQYHQIGQHFYLINELKTFVYDKYVSDLFNDYFDTTHRVTGFGIPNTFKERPSRFDVIIHGKSHPNYKDIGKYIYAVFTYDSAERILYSATHRDPQYFNTTIFGVGGYRGADYFVDAMYQMAKKSNTDSSVHIYLIWISRYNYTESTTIADRKYWLYYGYTHHNYDFMFAKKFSEKSWTKMSLGEIGSPELPFDDIIGLYKIVFISQGKGGIKNDRKLALSVRKDGDPNDIYFLNDNIDVNRSDIGVKSLSSYRSVFCGKPLSSDSNYSGSKLDKIVSVLIMIMLCLALVMAFYSYRINQKKIIQKIRALETINTSTPKISNDSGEKNSEQQSVGHKSNEMYVKPEQNSSQNS